MRILVTGGAGLIGSSLIRKYLDRGHDVLAVDTFTYGYAARPSAGIEEAISVRLDCLLDGARIERCSTLEKSRMRRLFGEFRPDCVVHLAAIPLVEVATKNVEAAADSLSVGLINVLEILREAPWTSRFVYASSSMVYGNFVLDPMPEDGPKAPLNIYGGLKLAGEILTRSYLHPTGIDHVIVRPSSVYGPTDQHRRVVQKFCENALDGKPVRVNDRNDHIMDFTYVADIAEGFYLASTHPNARNETFNMTYGQARTLSELVEVIRQSEPGLGLSQEDIDDSDRPTRGSLRIDKARRLLGYAPQWPLERGIPVYLEHLRGARVRTRLAGVA
jgi:nucleoside-diphosphate-sugar epimerase